MADAGGQEGAEKRRFDRLKAGLQVKFRPVGTTEEATLLKQGSFIAPETSNSSVDEIRDLTKVAAEDISTGGIRINTPVPLPEKAHLWLQVQLPGIPVPVNALGEVRWSRRAGSLCSSGVRFLKISAEDLGKVERFVALRASIPPEGGRP